MTFGGMYVSPEQLMKDRADYARHGIARGRPIIVVSYANGIAFVGENPSRSLHKISEIYDRIGFAAVGKYNEFENLRVAGIRYADLRGFSYDRTDVTGRGLANAYAQTLGSVFTQEAKPYEIEIAVAQVGLSVEDDQIFRLTYDGSVSDEPGFVAMGRGGDVLTQGLRAQWDGSMSLSQALVLCVDLLRQAKDEQPSEPVAPNQFEIAVLDRRRSRRAFRRLEGAELAAMLDPEDPLDDVAEGAR
ncbi:MAG: proteasome subunit alpha [Ornithinimicrobium sp.]